MIVSIGTAGQNRLMPSSGNVLRREFALSQHRWDEFPALKAEAAFPALKQRVRRLLVGAENLYDSTDIEKSKKKKLLKSGNRFEINLFHDYYLSLESKI